MDKRIVSLVNGWTAEFANQGEFRMSSEAWNMLLCGPAHRRIRHFEEEIVLVNDHDGAQVRSCIRLSDDGKYAYLTTGLEFAWVIDFSRCAFAPYRVYISHHQDDKHISVYEQPAFRRAQEYVTISGKLIYITFPFCTDEEFPRVWTQYQDIRKRQIAELYFKG